MNRTRLTHADVTELARLFELLEYECGSGDWPMQEAGVVVRERVERWRAHFAEPAKDG